MDIWTGGQPSRPWRAIGVITDERMVGSSAYLYRRQLAAKIKQVGGDGAVFAEGRAEYAENVGTVGYNPYAGTVWGVSAPAYRAHRDFIVIKFLVKNEPNSRANRKAARRAEYLAQHRLIWDTF